MVGLIYRSLTSGKEASCAKVSESLEEAASCLVIGVSDAADRVKLGTKRRKTLHSPRKLRMSVLVSGGRKSWKAAQADGGAESEPGIIV